MAGGSLQPFFEGWNGRGVVLALEPRLPGTQNCISSEPRGSFLDDSIEYRKAARRRRLGGDGRPLSVCVCVSVAILAQAQEEKHSEQPNGESKFANLLADAAHVISGCIRGAQS